jgi:hypothetical protein
MFRPLLTGQTVSRPRIRPVQASPGDTPRPPGRPDDLHRSSGTWLYLLALRRSPLALIVALGAVWTSVVAADGALAMSPIACWLWLTVISITRRAARRERLMRLR